MNNFLSCIANQTRLRIILCLHKTGPKSVTELLHTCDISQSALSQHLRILKIQNIVSAKKNGKHIIYSLTDKNIHHLAEKLLSESLK